MVLRGLLDTTMTNPWDLFGHLTGLKPTAGQAKVVLKSAPTENCQKSRVWTSLLI